MLAHCFLRRVEEKVKIVPSRRLNVEALAEQNPPEDKNQQYSQERGDGDFNRLSHYFLTRDDSPPGSDFRARSLPDQRNDGRHRSNADEPEGNPRLDEEAESDYYS